MQTIIINILSTLSLKRYCITHQTILYFNTDNPDISQSEKQQYKYQ